MNHENYVLKAVPEDFIVEELKDLKDIEKGDYSYYVLRKKDIGTAEAIGKISRKLHIDKKYINFAGNKDKKAVTSQHISISKGPENDFEEEKWSLKFIGKFKERINLGDLQGNHFEITVRNIESVPEIKKQFINYFDEQRFSKNNSEIGKLIIKKNFKNACELIENENVENFLSEKPNEYANALKAEKKLVKIYIHAYQSYLWNKYVLEYVKKYGQNIQSLDCSLGNLYFGDIESKKIPIIGFGTELDEGMEILLKEEGISQRDFLIRSIPELSSEGAERDLVAEAENVQIGKLLEDNLNKGKKRIVISFDLPKGSYATMFIKSLFTNKS
jgi:tRNA pseudouridine13 synthase